MRTGDKFLGLDLSAHLLPKYRRQLQSLARHGATIHLVVYDLLPLLRPEWFTPAAVANFREVARMLRTKRIRPFAFPNMSPASLGKPFTRLDAGAYLKLGRLKMGADIAASVPSSGVCDNLKRQLENLRFRPAILMVGTVEPRKGYEAALAAFEHLWRARPTELPDLIVVGKPGWKTSELQERIRSHPQFGTACGGSSI